MGNASSAKEGKLLKFQPLSMHYRKDGKAFLANKWIRLYTSASSSKKQALGVMYNMLFDMFSMQ